MDDLRIMQIKKNELVNTSEQVNTSELKSE